MKKKCLLIALSVVGLSGTINAEETVDTLGIIGRIASNPHLTVSHPEKLATRLLPERNGGGENNSENGEKTTPTANGGYRIQVFSGNNPRTARSEAHSRSASIKSEFPEWGTYVTFDSPYWRVKVGDFRNYDDARAALSLLKNHFPAFSKEMRLVRDRIKNGN